MNVPTATNAVAPMPNSPCHHTMLAMASAGEVAIKKTGVASNGNLQ